MIAAIEGKLSALWTFFNFQEVAFHFMNLGKAEVTDFSTKEMLTVLNNSNDLFYLQSIDYILNVASWLSTNYYVFFLRVQISDFV